MNDLTLCCILINGQLRILHNTFPLRIPGPFRAPHDICPFLRSAIPSLRDKNNSSFSFYEPLVTISSHQLGNLNETQVNLSAPIGITRFHNMNTDAERERFDSVDVIICVDGGASLTY